MSAKYRQRYVFAVPRIPKKTHGCETSSKKCRLDNRNHLPIMHTNPVHAECLLRGKTREDQLLGKLRKNLGACPLYTHRRDSSSRVFPPHEELKSSGCGMLARRKDPRRPTPHMRASTKRCLSAFAAIDGIALLGSSLLTHSFRSRS